MKILEAEFVREQVFHIANKMFFVEMLADHEDHPPAMCQAVFSQHR